MVAVLLAIALTASGVLQPTPARFRPPLPPPEPMPGLVVEDVIPELERSGFECGFDADERAGGWHCRRGDQAAGDYLDVAIRSDETGPLSDLSAYRVIQIGPDEGPEPAVLDQDAAASFHAEVIALIVPEDLRPTEAALLAAIQRNFPVELGDGWHLGFDRNAISRTMRVVFNGG